MPLPLCLPFSFSLGALLRKGKTLDDLFLGRPITVTSAPLGRPLFTIFGGNRKFNPGNKITIE